MPGMRIRRSRGTHLIVDVRSSNNCQHLTCPETVAALFLEICNIADMAPLGETTNFFFPEDHGRSLREGLTAMQCLSTSHQSYHSCLEEGGFSFDLFSCRDFDTFDVVEAITNWVNCPVARINSTVIRR